MTCSFLTVAYSSLRLASNAFTVAAACAACRESPVYFGTNTSHAHELAQRSQRCEGDLCLGGAHLTDELHCVLDLLLRVLRCAHAAREGRNSLTLPAI